MLNTIKALWNNNTINKKKLILTGLSLILLISYFWHKHSNQSIPSAPLKVVETEIVTPKTIRKTVKLIGTLQAKHTAILVAKSSGVLDTIINSGQLVKKGDLIAKIINPDIEKNYQLSKSTEKIAQAQYERLSGLQKTGYVSAKEAEEKKQVWIDAQKDLSKTKIELKNSRFYAPFDGIIGAFKRKEGTLINEGDAIVTVYDPLNLTIDVDIPCTNIKNIAENQPVRVFNHDYHLTHVQKMMDSDTHMCPADIDIHCKNCVIGDSVSIELVVKEKNQALIVPAQALFLKEGKTFVYKVNNNQIELAAVQSGIHEKDSIEIISGLHAGDEVISKSPERLYPGLNVTILLTHEKTGF